MKDKIIKAALSQILKYGLRGFTVDDICRSLGISKKTIYKYFDSKYEIISSVIDMHIEIDKAKTIEALDSETDILPKLKSVILYYYDYKVPLRLVDELRSYFPEQWSKISSLILYKQNLFRAILENGINSGKIKPNINIDVLMLIFEKTIPALIDYEFLLKHDVNYLTANKILDEFGNIVLNGISF